MAGPAYARWLSIGLEWPVDVVPQRTVLLLVVAARVAYSDELNRYNLPTLCNDNGFRNENAARQTIIFSPTLG